MDGRHILIVLLLFGWMGLALSTNHLNPREGYPMRLLRRRNHPTGNIPLAPEFLAQVEDLIRKHTREQAAAVFRALNHFEGSINQKLEKIMHTLEETLAAVEAESTSGASIIALLVGIKKQLDDALGGQLTPSQQMRVDAIFNKATANKDAIDAAVTANTETAPPPADKVPTRLSITSSLNPANAGDAITLSAGLDTHPDAPAGSPPPTGTITFFDGDTSLGSTTMDSTGVAALASSSFAGGNLSAGDHSLHATYSGDAVYAPSDSEVLDQTIATPASATAPAAPAPDAPAPAPTPAPIT